MHGSYEMVVLEPATMPDGRPAFRRTADHFDVLVDRFGLTADGIALFFGALAAASSGLRYSQLHGEARENRSRGLGTLGGSYERGGLGTLGMFYREKFVNTPLCSSAGALAAPC